MIHYIGKVLRPMSVLEIIIYSLLGAVVLGLCFKWFIYDLLIKPKRKAKKVKTQKDEEDE